MSIGGVPQAVSNGDVADNFQGCLHAFADAVKKNLEMTEQEVYNNLVSSRFFEILGYEGYGIDVRSQQPIRGYEPDYYCLDTFEKTIFVTELKKPSDDQKTPLEEYKDKQLSEKYVIPLRARYGILTNGVRFILYERVGQRLVERVRYADLSIVTAEEAGQLCEKLRKPSIDLTALSEVTSRIKESLQEPKDLSVETAQRDFFQIFKLNYTSKFGELVKAIEDLLDYCLTEKSYKFTNGAYAFWLKSYTVELDEVPKPWEPFTKMRNLGKFMFCLETAHALVSRLILAKVSEDFALPGVGVLSELESDVGRYSYRGRTSLIVYPLAVTEVLSKLQDALVESIFEEDLFMWWHDALRVLNASHPRELLEIRNPALEKFGKSLIEVVIALYAFDFKNVEDIIGDLYQEYFDKDTRKALGEFYTPTPIVEYILDKVSYQGFANERLLDLSCGSGTFVVQALKRYLQRSSRRASVTGWDQLLDNLCNEPKIVGFDLNPFAVLMAQVRYMIELVPYYKKAIEANHGYTLKTIPIFTTDSLWSEKAQAVGPQTQIIGFTERGGDIIFSFELPIQESPGKFVFIEFSMPTRNKLGLDNADQHFIALRALFGQVKKSAGKKQYVVDSDFEDQFREKLLATAELENPTRLVSELKPYAERILSKIKELYEKYDDGRLIKSMEDRVLAGILKNFVTFDYVVGNPPWVSKKTKKIFLSDAYQADLIKLYTSANADFDLHIPFIERGLSMLKKGGKLGYIVSNTFFKTSYGETIRAILTQNKLLHIVDFTDYDVFEEPTNYSAILIVQRAEDEQLYSTKINNDGTIDCARVCFWSSDLESLMDAIRKGKSSKDLDIFKLKQDTLSSLILAENGVVNLIEFTPSKAKIQKRIPVSDIWVVAPTDELSLMRKLEKMTEVRLGSCEVIRDGKCEKINSDQRVLSDKVFVGIQLDGKEIYAVRSVDNLTMDEILDKKEVVVESTKMPGRQWTLETKMLRFLIDGKHITRWFSDWEQELVIFPYFQKNGDFDVITPTKLHQNYPGVYHYLRDAEVLQALDEASADRHKLHEELKNKFNVETMDELAEKLADPKEIELLGEQLYWYRYIYRKNIESVDSPKIMVCTTATQNRFSGDLQGVLAPHNVRVYSMLVRKKDVPFCLSVFNSKLFGFYLNHVAVIKKGKTFEYIKQCLSLFPVKLPASRREKRLVERMMKIVSSCVELRHMQQKIERFPDSYLHEFEGIELDKLVYRFHRDHVDIKAELQRKISGTQFDIQVGGAEAIESPYLTSQVKAKYLKTCLDGRTFRRDDKLAIPVPRDDSVCEKLMRRLEKDRALNPQESLEKLEKENDACIFSYYEISKKERAIIEEFVSRFSADYVKSREEELKKGALKKAHLVQTLGTSNQ